MIVNSHNIQIPLPILTPTQQTLVQPKKLYGIRARTTHVDELCPRTAKVERTWRAFWRHLDARIPEEPEIYHVFTNYEGDNDGDEFDLIVCTDAISGPAIAGVKNAMSVALAAGNYLIFTAKGDSPDILVYLWDQIWDYFDQPDCPHERAFTTDFERYVDNDRVTIYIAIK